MLIAVKMKFLSDVSQFEIITIAIWYGSRFE